jgi:hypothetical protein
LKKDYKHQDKDKCCRVIVHASDHKDTVADAYKYRQKHALQGYVLEEILQCLPVESKSITFPGQGPDEHDQTQNEDYGSKNPGYDAGNRQGIGTEFFKSRHLEGMKDNPDAKAHKQYGHHEIGLGHVFLFHSISPARLS